MIQLPERKKLGQVLVEKSYLSDSRLESALVQQKANHQPLGKVLLELGYVSPSQLNESLAAQAGIEKIDIDSVVISQEILSFIPAEIANRYNVLPLSSENGTLSVAMAQPFDRRTVEDLRLITGLLIRRFFAYPDQLERAILKFYGSDVARMLDNLAPVETKLGNQGNGQMTTARLQELAREPSLVNLVNLILLEAIDARASDVHIEPFENEVKIKYRIDGMLTEKTPSSKKLQAAIISRIKIMANMNIAERFVPQDGHIEFVGNAGIIDIRVSTVPSIFGESVTMRILDRSAALIKLEDLGMNENVLVDFEQSLKKVHGIILVTGPTGSGKTTTLYAALNKIYSPSLKIITIEDPVEYQLDGIVQMPVNPQRGLTFAKGLRHIVRQDPDIIMVGEIRDRETAEIAIRSALTGHLVFSTLHTNDAAGAISRLIDMGVEPFLLASSLEAVLAQRLVRRICPACSEIYTPDATLARTLRNSISIDPDMKFRRGTGCRECNGTGMKGRIGIFELLKVNESVRQLISQKATLEQIKNALPSEQEVMRHDGIRKILAGITTHEEVLRVTQSIEEE